MSKEAKTLDLVFSIAKLIESRKLLLKDSRGWSLITLSILKRGERLTVEAINDCKHRGRTKYPSERFLVREIQGPGRLIQIIQIIEGHPGIFGVTPPIAGKNLILFVKIKVKNLSTKWEIVELVILRGQIQKVTVSERTERVSKRFRQADIIENGGLTNRKGSKNLRVKKSGFLVGLKIESPSRMVQKALKTVRKQGRRQWGFHHSSE